MLTSCATDKAEIKPASSSETGEIDEKPVIYLYDYKGDVNVKLDFMGDLTCTYPKYTEGGWNVIASKDGHLKDKSGNTYRYLYWEGSSDIEWDFSKGFCVKGEETAGFLRNALVKLGLNSDEINEFIIYWLPKMQDNQYNVISFQNEKYTDIARLNVTPVPDCLIRVFMAWYPSDEYVEIEEQELSAPTRKGKTVVEWGGSESSIVYWRPSTSLDEYGVLGSTETDKLITYNNAKALLSSIDYIGERSSADIRNVYVYFKEDKRMSARTYDEVSDILKGLNAIFNKEKRNYVLLKDGRAIEKLPAKWEVTSWLKKDNSNAVNQERLIKLKGIYNEKDSYYNVNASVYLDQTYRVKCIQVKLLPIMNVIATTE